jgi:hypothetical protein
MTDYAAAVTKMRGYIANWNAALAKGPLDAEQQAKLAEDLKTLDADLAGLLVPVDPPAPVVVPIPSAPKPPPYQSSIRTWSAWATAWEEAHGFAIDKGAIIDIAALKVAALAEGPETWFALCASGNVGNPINASQDGADYHEFTEVIGFDGDPTATAPQGSGYYAIVLGKVVNYALGGPGFDTVAFGVANGISF